MILDNLRKAGVQNTVQERAPRRSTASTRTPGEWIQADGRVHRRGRQDAPRRRLHRPGVRHRRPGAGQGGRQGGGQGRRLRPARRLRLRLRPARRRGGRSATASSPSSPARMNPDLAMGDELLKKTGAGNLFMVFGEPDIDVDAAGGRQARWSRSAASTSTTRPPGEIRSSIHRRHRLLVHRHRLQRRELLRPPRLLHRRRRALRQAQARAPRRHRRGSLGDALLAPSSRPFAAPDDRQDRRQGHQPLRRRGAEGVQGVRSELLHA